MWIPAGWHGVELLAVRALAKILATSLTVGSGGSAGDFGPSLVIGGLLGGASGRAAQSLVNPAIDPGAFALVGMGTFYGGLAHAPLSSAVMVCEMAGSYDLLVPRILLEAGSRELPVVDEHGAILGLLDESDITRAYHNDIVRRTGDANLEPPSHAPAAPRTHGPEVRGH